MIASVLVAKLQTNKDKTLKSPVAKLATALTMLVMTTPTSHSRYRQSKIVTLHLMTKIASINFQCVLCTPYVHWKILVLKISRQ